VVSYDKRVARLLEIGRTRFGAALEEAGVGLTLRPYGAGEWARVAPAGGGPGWEGTRPPPALVFVRLSAGKWRSSSAVPLFTPSYITFLSNTNAAYFVPGCAGEATCAQEVLAGLCPPPLPQSAAALAGAIRAVTLREAGRGDPEQVPVSRVADDDEPQDTSPGSGEGVGDLSWPPSPLLLPPPMPPLFITKALGAPTASSASGKRTKSDGSAGDPPSAPGPDIEDDEGSIISLSSARSSPALPAPARYLRHPLSPLTRLVWGGGGGGRGAGSGRQG